MKMNFPERCEAPFRYNKILIIVSFLFAIIMQFACNNSAPKYTDTPTSGVVKIAVDETLAPILDSEISTFMALYKDAKVIAKYEPEADVFKDMLNDSASLGIVARELNENEKAVFTKQVIDPITTRIAIDAIAFIINNENTSGQITFPRMKEILSGKMKTWHDADDQNKLGTIKVVFDNTGSSTARLVRDSLIAGKISDWDGVKHNVNWYAMKTNPEVVDYVSKNKDAIGILGVSWISDAQDSLTVDFLKKVKVVALTSNDPRDMEYYKPYQAYIAMKNYPVCRNIYVINREARTGLGTGFAGYIAGETGQLIIKKMGLLPATQSVRLVHLQPQNLQ